MYMELGQARVRSPDEYHGMDFVGDLSMRLHTFLG
jgi:hypothetical protein